MDKINSVLWEIKHKRQNCPSYLFGTIHAYNPAIISLPENLFSLINKCDILALELNNSDFSYADLMKHIIIEDENISIKDLLSPESYELLLSLEGFREMEEKINRYKPFFITNLFLKNYDVTTSIEDLLKEFAEESGKNVVGLETLESQMKAVDSIPLKMQANILEESLLNGGNAKEELNKMMLYYSRQNFEAMKQSTKLNSIKNLFLENIQSKRNINMVEHLIQLIENNTVFAAVGALHLPDIDDKKGMISLLKEKNCTLTPIEINLNTQ